MTDILREIRSAYRRHEHARRASEEATAALGDLVREHWPSFQESRTVAFIARDLGVDRSFLYKVAAGTHWVNRKGTDEPA